MPKNRVVSRDSIVTALTKGLQARPSVHAFWEAGAAAFDRIDAWSDLDLYIVVDDGAVPDTFQVVEDTLVTLSPIRVKHEVSWPPASGIHQKFYRLEDTDEYLLVDLAVMTVAAPDKFLVREIHGNAVIYFDKDGTVAPPPLDRESFVRALLERRRRLIERMELFGPFVQKEMGRGHQLEALEFYRTVVIPYLVEALRMHHGPLHYDFRMRYVYQELPPETVSRIERLAFVTDAEDLTAKYREAMAWFHKTVQQVDEKEIRQRVSGG